MKLRNYKVVKGGETYSYWRADLGVIDGKRVQKQFGTKEAAQAYLKAKRGEQTDGGAAVLSFADSDRLAFVALRDKLAPMGATLADAVEFFLANRPKQLKSLGEAFGECVLAKRVAGRRKRYVDALEAYLQKFIAGRESAPAHSITAADVEQWFAVRGESMLTGGKLSYICALFSYCVKRGYCQSNPCEAVERPTVDRSAPVVLTADECAALLGACCTPVHVELLGYVALCLFAGVRPEECEKLDWSAVDLENKRVVIDEAVSKTHRRRITDLSANAVAWLSLVGVRSGRVAPGSGTWRNKRMRALRAAAGVKWCQDIMRHTAASQMMARDRDAARVADQLGNSPGILLTHYRALVTPEESAKFWALAPK